jgi:hypothetical protein
MMIDRQLASSLCLTLKPHQRAPMYVLMPSTNADSKEDPLGKTAFDLDFCSRFPIDNSRVF